MKKNNHPYRFLFAAGGTGGHLFPALAVAEEIREIKPESEILFVGTKTKLEAEIVPRAGFNFKSINISGFQRRFSLSNILFPFKLLIALVQSLWINTVFNPKVAIGAGAYVAGPALWGSWVMGAKIILLEQNSYPGITNRLLERKANEIHLTFEESKKYFRFKDKLFLTGNPVRNILILSDKAVAKKKLGLDPLKKTLLVLSGSLGAESINKAIETNLKNFEVEGIQIIWQTGKRYYEQFKKFESENVKVFGFIPEMETVYSAADLAVARAGATTIAELSYLGLPAILIPSPNVAANHQEKNARALYENGACEMIKDDEVTTQLFEKAKTLLSDEMKLKDLSEKIKNFSKPEAAKVIAKRAIRLAEAL